MTSRNPHLYGLLKVKGFVDVNALFMFDVAPIVASKYVPGEYPLGKNRGLHFIFVDDGGTGVDSRLSLSLDPGTYFLFVDGFSSSSSGTYLLEVSGL